MVKYRKCAGCEKMDHSPGYVQTSTKHGEGSRFVNRQDDREIGIHDNTGQVMMLDKKERRLLRLVLGVSLKSESAKQYITKTLGPRFITVGENLLNDMGGED